MSQTSLKVAGAAAAGAAAVMDTCELRGRKLPDDSKRGGRVSRCGGTRGRLRGANNALGRRLYNRALLPMSAALIASTR
jgi:hypothetical protein